MILIFELFKVFEIWCIWCLYLWGIWDTYDRVIGNMRYLIVMRWDIWYLRYLVFVFLRYLIFTRYLHKHFLPWPFAFSIPLTPVDKQKLWSQIKSHLPTFLLCCSLYLSKCYLAQGHKNIFCCVKTSQFALLSGSAIGLTLTDTRRQRPRLESSRSQCFPSPAQEPPLTETPWLLRGKTGPGLLCPVVTSGGMTSPAFTCLKFCTRL